MQSGGIKLLVITEIVVTIMSTKDFRFIVAGGWRSPLALRITVVV
jgi:hypothetical protein